MFYSNCYGFDFETKQNKLTIITTSNSNFNNFMNDLNKKKVIDIIVVLLYRGLL